MRIFGSTKTTRIRPAKRLAGSVRVPGDKSISHRYAMLAAIAEGPSEVHYFSSSADCRSTLVCLEKLGAKIDRKDETLTIQGGGLRGLRQPSGHAPQKTRGRLRQTRLHGTKRRGGGSGCVDAC